MLQPIEKPHNYNMKLRIYFAYLAQENIKSLSQSSVRSEQSHEKKTDFVVEAVSWFIPKKNFRLNQNLCKVAKTKINKIITTNNKENVTLV